MKNFFNCLNFSSNNIYKTRFRLYQYNDRYFRLVKIKSCRLPGFVSLEDKIENKIKVSSSEIERISNSRTKREIRELALSNEFEYFVTLTINSDFCNRYSEDVCFDELRKILKAYRRKNENFRYLLIAEYHQDQAVHFHGLFKGLDVADLYINQNYYLSSKFFDKIGFNSFSKIKDYYKCCNYILKYISKQPVRSSSRRCYIASRDLNRAIIHDLDIKSFDDNFFTYNNDYCSIRDFDITKVDKKILLKFIDN